MHTHKGVQSFKRPSEQSCCSSTSAEGVWGGSPWGTRMPLRHLSSCFEHVQAKGAPEADPAHTGGIIQHLPSGPGTPWCSLGRAGGGSEGEDGLGLPPVIAAHVTQTWKWRTEQTRSVAGEDKKKQWVIKHDVSELHRWTFGLRLWWAATTAVTREGRETMVNSRWCSVMIPRWCYNSTHILDFRCNNTAGELA